MRRRYRIGSAIILACLPSILLILEGCSSTPPPSGIHFPITSGFHTLLPSERQRILIWGDPLLARVAEAWLRSHHYSNILMQPQIPRPSSDRQTALAVAAEANAEFVLILEREELKEGALIQANCGPRFNISVDVRGLLMERGVSVLRGNAHYPHCVEHTDQTLQNLTCQALATAWGFRPSGQLEIPSYLTCTAGQNAPVPNR
ncbi:MAG: hypothetical protein HP496_13815 [Nitrospira sp.]|nr:hypothetical protein [Nitrospira sp.]